MDQETGWSDCEGIAAAGMKQGEAFESMTRLDRLRTRAERLPRAPGVYLMKDGQGRVIYVGKASDLRARVRTYFAGGDGRVHVAFLLNEVAEVDFSLTSSAREALILEDVLIKKFRPRYNIRLKDDKTYLSIRIDLRDPFPRLELMRRPPDDGARRFGPFSSAASTRRMVGFIRRHFPLRSCEDAEFRRRRRPCLEHQIGRCLAPCVGRVSREAYREVVDQVILVLEGKRQELRRVLEAEMRRAADALEFEKAAEFRDRLRALELVTARQEAVTDSSADQDAIGYCREGGDLAVAVVPVRKGRMQDSRTFFFEGTVAGDEDALASFLLQYYRDGEEVPAEILLPEGFGQSGDVAAVLGDRAERRVRVATPVRGRKHRLLALADRTAQAVLAQERDQGYRAMQAARELQRLLRLPEAPATLECFDISNIGGKRPVGSRVRFENGMPDRSRYRHYRIKTLEEEPNDYAMMGEVLRRRLVRGLREGDLPDLLVVDGGKGHLNVAVHVLAELHLTGVPVLSLAKPDRPGARAGRAGVDKIYLPGRKNPVLLPPHSPALKLLQALRDESHRFAITHHRSLRRKAATRSTLEDIPGIGKTRSARLLRTFGSVKRLRQADEAEIAAVEGIGTALAREIVTWLHRSDPPGNHA